MSNYDLTLCKLKNWLRGKGVTLPEFARSLGISPHSLSWIMHKRAKGRRYFSTEQASEIEKMTSGEIRASDLLTHLVPEGYALVPICDGADETSEQEAA